VPGRLRLTRHRAENLCRCNFSRVITETLIIHWTIRRRVGGNRIAMVK
jgi:hypothetical protein